MGKEHTLSYFTLEPLSESEWAEIKNLSIQLHGSMGDKHDMFFCVVAAFFLWMSHQEQELLIEPGSFKLPPPDDAH